MFQNGSIWICFQTLAQRFLFFVRDRGLTTALVNLGSQRAQVTLLTHEIADDRGADRKPLGDRCVTPFAGFISLDNPLA